MAKKLTSTKARKILHDKEVHGHPLTEKQRKFFGAIAGGAKPYKAQVGGAFLAPITPQNVSDFFELFSIPQKAITKLVTGKYQTPSEAMGIKNKAGAIATDILLDPVNLIGAGGAARQAIKFKPKPGMMYRGLGKEGMEDALKSGVFRAKQEVEPYMIGNFDVSKRFNKAYFSPKFDVADQYGQGFIAEVPRTASDWGKRYGRKDWSQIAQKDIPITEGKILQKDWLRGYKEVKQPKKKQDGGWLDKYEQGGLVLKQKTHDNYGKKANPNNPDVKLPPGFKGWAYNTKGRNYSPAWGGQFKDGGNIMPAMAGANQTVPMYQMGGVLPGAVGFTYARTVGAAPSNGPYAKKTKASAQNGQEMKFYQEGLDFKPKTISQDGSEIPVDPMGYWNPENIGNPVIIPSTDITMEGVDQPLIGISDTGDVQYMEPGEDYEFEGEYVTEYPVAKKGISVNNADAQPIKKLDQLLNFTNYNKPTKGGWLSKYQYGGGVLSRSNLETMAALEKDIKNQKARNAQETVSQYTPKPRDQQRMNTAKDAYRAEEAKPLNRAASSRVAAKAMENIVEPMLAIETGMGAGKLVKPALETAGKYLTEKTALKNAYKINPYAFKPNKTSAYRMIGDERGYIDAVESGFLKPGKGSDIGKMHTETHFQMGVPSDKREYFGRTWSRGYDGPYMAEVLNAANDARFSSGPGGKLMGNNVWTYPENYIPTSQAKIYKQDWLKGYKEIAKKEDGGWLNKYK